MQFIQGLLADSLNGFSLKFIPFFLLQLFSAGIFAFIIQYLVNKKFKEQVLVHAPLIAVTICMVASIVKFSLPFAVLGAAVVILVLGLKQKSQLATIGTVVIAAIAIGCGIGSIVQTFIGVVIIALVVLLTPLKEQS
ncbi:MAG: hypothetical protein HUJ25_00555 [Crocinitomicaceae bacterium]|nr:hypothetical protein [Crocinitomicaceae bacterium]